MEPKSSSTIPKGNHWIAQVKWDGVRVLTYHEKPQVRLFNRKLRERTLHYPEITDVPSFCDAGSVILDGEVIALGPDGKPSFREVMRRDGVTRLERVEAVRKSVPIIYMVFDIIYLNGQWINTLPFSERTEILANVLRPNEHVQIVSSESDSQALWTVMKDYGMEGIVVKQKQSPYYIAQERDVWLKVKNYRDLIAVIGGFTLRGEIINSILLGLYDKEGKLWYIGHAGAGKMTQHDWRELTAALRPMAVPKPPFVNKPERHRDALWVQPQLTVKVKYAEWTEGGALRQPTIEGFTTVPPEECRVKPFNN